MLRCRIRWIILVAVTLLNYSAAAHASPEPIVFDFEDGLQGWTLGGSAQRVQTDALGGAWVIFGDTSVDRHTSIQLEINLSDIDAISWTQLYTGDEDRTTFLSVIFQTSVLAVFSAISFPGPDANPGTRRFDIPRGTILPLDDPVIVDIRWIPQSPPPESQFGHSDGFIDNITFHPVPEPSTWALLGFGVSVLFLARRRRV